MFSFVLTSALVAASFVSAQHDNQSPLDKPSLVGNLDYLRLGLGDTFLETDYVLDQWDYGMIPEDCKTIVTGGVIDTVVYNAGDFEMYNVTYSDCGDPWVFCHHKDSEITIDSMAAQFGKLPIQMRQWVRHVVDVPADVGWAFEWDGVITFVRPNKYMLSTLIHETGHSLDLSGAYADNPLSASDSFFDAYNSDSNVPDDYSQTNLIEDLAQNTVVAVYDQNVDGGYPGIEPNSAAVQNQYGVVVAEAEAAGVGNSLLVPGQSQMCTKRMPPSIPVPVDSVDADAASGGQSKMLKGSQNDASALSDGIHVIDTSKRLQKFVNCTLTW